MLRFDWAQSFYVDPSFVDTATEIALTKVDLWFRAKPPAEGNKSGIYKPGVELKIVPTLNGLPVVNQVGAYRPTEPVEHGAKFAFYSGGQTARVEYDEIRASTNALIPTEFLFQSPVFVPTAGEYAVIIKFDGAESYVLWSVTYGDILIGTTTVAVGPSGNLRGTLYQFISDPSQTGALLPGTGYAYGHTTIDPNIANSAALVYTSDTNPMESSDPTYLQSNWTPLVNQMLKMRVYAARYFINGQSVQTLEDFHGNTILTSTVDRPVILAPNTSVLSNNVIRLTAPVQETEYVLYNMRNSTRDFITYGETIYQDGPMWPGDSNPVVVTCSNVSIVANGSYAFANGSTFNSTGGFGSIVNVNDSLILKNIDSNTYHLRTVAGIPSNNTILVGGAPFSEEVSATFRIAPIAFLNELANTVVYNKKHELMTLYNSIVNSEVRFVGNSISSIVVQDAGTGYSNDDYLVIEGFEDIDYAVKGNYAAYANIETDASGNIVAFHFSNTGAGFNNSQFLEGANVNIYQSSNGVGTEDPSDGSNASLTFTIGSTFRSLMSNTRFANCQVVNFEVSRMKPEIWVNNPLGTGFTIWHRTQYYSVRDANTSTGKAYYADTPAESTATDTLSKIYKATKLNIPGVDKTPVLTSRSNEYAIRFANGAVNTQNTYGEPFSNTAVFLFDISSNNDYQVVWFDPEVVVSHYSRYIINNDYTGEHTNYGEAIAKHVAQKINLAKGRLSEDVVIYMDAYRPARTDFRVYARVKHSDDEDAFDDLDWTLLEQVDGVGLYSSSSDDSDYKELTYNLRAYPNTDFTLTGSGTIRQGNAHVIGAGTTFGPIITITNGGTGYTNGNILSWTAPTGRTDAALDNIYALKNSVNATATVATNTTGGISGLTLLNMGYGWTSQAVVSNFTVANTSGSPSGGSGGTITFRPGLQQGDLIKIYSPYSDWANTNYTTAVVNTVVTNTDLTIVRTYGELGAVLTGNVNINSTSNTLAGTGTFFSRDLSEGDLIAIWANSSVYEVKEVRSIVSNTSLTMDTVGTFTNTATFYASVISDTFMNASLTVDGLKIDRIAYPHQAFNNAGNDNVCRYYNSSMIQFDGYDTLQVKVVLLSDSDHIIPKVDDIRGVLVSA